MTNPDLIPVTDAECSNCGHTAETHVLTFMAGFAVFLDRNTWRCRFPGCDCTDYEEGA